MRAQELHLPKPIKLNQCWNPAAKSYQWGIHDSFKATANNPAFILENVFAFAGLSTDRRCYDQALYGRISHRILEACGKTIDANKHRLANKNSHNLVLDAKNAYKQSLIDNRLDEHAASKKANRILENFSLTPQTFTPAVINVLTQTNSMISHDTVHEPTKKTIFSLSVQPVPGLMTFRTKSITCSSASEHEFTCEGRTYARTNSLDIKHLPDRCFGIIKDNVDLSKLTTGILIFSNAKKQANLKNTLPHETVYTISDLDNTGNTVEWDLVLDLKSDILENTADLQQLDEVAMSPSALKEFLNSTEAEGIRAGFEAELIFRDTAHDRYGGGGDYDSEPDYDMDERARSIDEIIDFFRGGDYGMSRGEGERLRERLYEEFMEWQQEAFYNDEWNESTYTEWVRDNIWPDVRDEYLEKARQELEDEGQEYTDETVAELADSMFVDEADSQFNDQGDWFQQAEEALYDDFRENNDESQWLGSEYRWMSDIESAFDLSWPYYTEPESSGGSRTWQDIGETLAYSTGLKVKVSGGYHGLRRGDFYVIEPDSSLDADDSDDYGLEIVSPPLPLAEAVEQLKLVIDWANNDGNAYTNSSTGLHMGVSLPYKGGDVDPVKLILFMGDKELLARFDRSMNTYTRSAYDRLRSRIGSMRGAGPKQISGVMDLMRRNLIELAERDLKRNLLGDKYVSVHPQSGYIEFRGPGGDYLAKSDEIDGVLENTMLRLARAMYIAGRPDLYRDEYAKKLYKLLTRDDPENPFLKLLSDYQTRSITGDELKRKWAQTVLDIQQDKQDQDTAQSRSEQQDYEVFDRRTGEVLEKFTADGDQAAVNLMRSRYAAHRDLDYGIRRLKVTPPSKPDRRAALAKRLIHGKLKSASSDQSSAADDIVNNVGQPQGEFTGRWKIINSRTGEVLHTFGGIGNSQADANRHAREWILRNAIGVSVEVVPEMR